MRTWSGDQRDRVWEGAARQCRWGIKENSRSPRVWGLGLPQGGEVPGKGRGAAMPGDSPQAQGVPQLLEWGHSQCLQTPHPILTGSWAHPSCPPAIPTGMGHAGDGCTAARSMLAGDHADIPGALRAAGCPKSSQQPGTGIWPLPMLPSVGTAGIPAMPALEKQVMRHGARWHHCSAWGSPAAALAPGGSAGGTGCGTPGRAQPPSAAALVFTCFGNVTPPALTAQ